MYIYIYKCPRGAMRIQANGTRIAFTKLEVGDAQALKWLEALIFKRTARKRQHSNKNAKLYSEHIFVFVTLYLPELI